MYSDTESVEFLATELSQPPTHVADALLLAEGEPAIKRVRLIRNHDRPIELSTSWFQGELATVAPGLLVAERLRGGTAKYVASVTDRDPSYARDQVMARLANADERRRLEQARPSAVLVYWLTIYDTRDRPMQFDEAIYPAERWAFRQEYPFAGP